jgi:hypothetical protein
MTSHRKLIVRSLQITLTKRSLRLASTYGNCELLQDYKVDDDLLLREALGERTLRSYLRAIGIATGKRVSYSEAMTAGQLIEALGKS